MVSECENYLNALVAKIANLAGDIHQRDSWVKYEDLIAEIQLNLKKYSDCEVLKNAYDSLVSEYRHITENGMDRADVVLLNISNEINTIH